MTKFLETSNAENDTPGFGGYAESAHPPQRRRWRILLTVTGILAAVIVAGSVGGYLYWRSFAETPQYSLALLVEAARRNDQAEMDRFISIDNVVDEFIPQITGKAIELYGRGVSQQTIARVAR